jgi:phage-related minor tail protein
MAFDASIGVNLIGRDVSASSAIKGVGDTAKSTSDQIKDAGAKAGIAFAAISAGALMAAKSAAEDEQSSTMLANSLKNVVGATDATVKSVEDYINKTTLATGIADDKLRPAFQRLVSSTKDVGEAQKLTNLAMEIATAKHLDVELVANALAKANDGNVNSLKKLGITLGDNANNLAAYNKEQKAISKLTDEATYALQEYGKGSKQYQSILEKINKHTEIANGLHKAGIDVFQELGDTFKGSLAANADTAAGRMAIMQNSIIEAKESVGYALLPALEALTGVFQKLAPFIQDNADIIGKTVLVVGALTGAVMLAGAAVKAYETITKAMAIAQGLLNAVMAMNPIALVVIAIAALTAAFVLAYQHSETFRNIVTGAFNAVKTVAESVADAIVWYFKTGISVIKFEINAVISLANMAIRALNGIHISLPSWIPGLGGKSFGIDLPEIPKLADGGIVTKPTLAMIGEAGAEAVIPLNKGGMGGGINVTVNVGGSVVQEQDLAVSVRDQIAILMRRRGLNPSILGV